MTSETTPGPIAQAIMGTPLFEKIVDQDNSLKNRIGLEIANLQEATKVIVENHYLHRGRTMGQIAYWVTLDGQRCGVLLFALPRLSVKFRGHGPMNLVELARMWLHPDVQGLKVLDSKGVEHTFAVGTAAVGASLRRIRQDWHGKYPHLPLISACVSWADDVHHEGTIYRASNFKEVGKSGGSMHGTAKRKNGGRDKANADYVHPKSAFMFEYSKVLVERQLEDARKIWDPIRPKRPKPKAVIVEDSQIELFEHKETILEEAAS
jgi:hypothetical protein